MSGSEALLDVPALAARLNVPRQWVYHRTRLNLIPHIRLGSKLRFEPDAIDGWLAAARMDGAGPQPRSRRR